MLTIWHSELSVAYIWHTGIFEMCFFVQERSLRIITGYISYWQVLRLACPAGDVQNTGSSNDGVFVSMRGVCNNVRARTNATFSVNALNGLGEVLDAVNRTIYVHVGVPWRPVEMMRHSTSIDTSVLLVWRTAYVAPSDGFLLQYWCVDNGTVHLANELKTRARHVTLRRLDGCEEFAVR